ncbi:hypothetical protein V6N13_053628 [Hibiscus sabdariffa]
MKLVFGFTVLLLIGFALGNEVFSEETKSAFAFAFDFDFISKQTSSSSSFNVMDYGAVGNGLVDDSQAFDEAWKAVCSANVGEETATLVVPQGKTFLLDALVFEGPCLPKTLHFQIGGSVIAPQGTSWGNGQVDAWIHFSSIENLILDGGGTINGQGSSWDFSSIASVAPFGLRLKGLTHLDSPMLHISINDCKDVVLSHLHIMAPGDSPNTDGIDISNSINVQIQDSTIGTGDDCVAINGGSSFINIIGVNCGPGHGISIGSLGDGAFDTVEGVHVKNCNFSNTQNGVRIKTFKVRVVRILKMVSYFRIILMKKEIVGWFGFRQNISFEQILFDNVKNPIIIDQFYEEKIRYRSYGIWEKAAGGIKVSDVTYSDVRGTSASEQAINLDCNNGVGCSNIVMRNIDITPSGGGGGPNIQGLCHNAHGTAFHVKPQVPCLS